MSVVYTYDMGNACVLLQPRVGTGLSPNICTYLNSRWPLSRIELVGPGVTTAAVIALLRTGKPPRYASFTCCIFPRRVSSSVFVYTVHSNVYLP
jgi:hypothetical protein